MSDLLAMLWRVFIEKRSATVIYMYDRWNDNEKQSQLYLFSATRTTAINGFVKRFLVLINSNSLVWTTQNCITKNAKILSSETRCQTR